MSESDWADPDAVARMVIAMVSEVASAELYAGEPQPRLRAAVFEVLRSEPEQ